MTLRLGTIKDFCNRMRDMVGASYPGLQCFYIIHHEGQRQEAVTLDMQELIEHPGFDNAQRLMTAPLRNEESSFMGFAVSHKRGLLGLGGKTVHMAMFTVNLSQYDSDEDAQGHICHLTSHALDIFDMRNSPELKAKFKSGVVTVKLNPLGMTKANLRADVFSVVINALEGDGQALNNLAWRRAQESLTARAGHRAEYYPFPVAIEAAQAACQEMLKRKISSSRIALEAHRIAQQVGQTFDEQTIRNWWAFSAPAQDMAWRSMRKEQILGAAIYTSRSAHVRANGYQISEILKIEPLDAGEIKDIYNAFADNEANAALHERAIQGIFEDVMTAGLEENSSMPFIHAANRQNSSLTEGHILGWCAAALQAAAKAFDTAQTTGISPSVAARLEFEGSKSMTTWETIKQLGESIVKQRRMGYAVTFSDLARICDERPELAPILKSISMTMKDPSYVQKLQAANDLTPVPSLHTPTPGIQPDLAPSAGPAMQPRTPGLGSKGGSDNIRSRIMQDAAARRQKEETGSASDDWNK